MPEQQITGFRAFRDQPLIGFITQENGRDVIHYFTQEADAEAANSSASVQRVLDLFGAWSDLDWDQLEEALYHIRHDSPPSPPISL